MNGPRPVSLFDHCTLSELVAQLRQIKKRWVSKPYLETQALFALLVKAGEKPVLETRSMVPLSGTGLGIGVVSCIHWKGQTLTASGETFEQVMDGRYPGYETVYQPRVEFYSSTDVPPEKNSPFFEMALDHMEPAFAELMKAFSQAQALKQACPPVDKDKVSRL